MSDIEKISQIPTIEDLYSDNLELAFKRDQLKMLLNAKPREKWLKKHPMAKKKVYDENGKENTVPIDYLPIDKVEFLLDTIFKEWNVEVISVIQLFNAVSVTVRLHYQNPFTKEMRFQDGVGAVSVQTDKGAVASDLSAIKQNAVQIALPAAKSYAIKDACEHLGDLFGRNLNRAESIAFIPTIKDPSPEEKRLDKMIDQFTKKSDLESIRRDVERFPELFDKFERKLSELK